MLDPMTANGEVAPEFQISEWLNSERPIELARLRGLPVILHAFQMLCPGCVSHAIPQTQRVQQIFAKTDLVVLGLHTVFEHHQAMTPLALRAFAHEYRLTFPIGIDQPGSPGPTPRTMESYRMRGTPTTILIDREGRLAAQFFGQIEDLALGAMIQSLLERNRLQANSSTEHEIVTPIGCATA